jgi:hypothetical protein
LKVVLWNICGFQDFKYDQYLLDKNGDIIILTETWAKPNVNLPIIPGYTLCFQNNRDYIDEGALRGSGGVAIYVSDRISAYVQLWNSDQQGSVIWIKVRKEIGTLKDLFIAGCYFPPHNSSFYERASTPDLFQDLTMTLLKLLVRMVFHSLPVT